MAFFLVLTQYSWFCLHQTLPEYQECLLTDTGFTVNYLDNAFALPKGSPFRWHVSSDGSDRKIIRGQKKSVQLFFGQIFTVFHVCDAKCLWWIMPVMEKPVMENAPPHFCSGFCSTMPWWRWWSQENCNGSLGNVARCNVAFLNLFFLFAGNTKPAFLTAMESGVAPLDFPGP